MHFGVVQRLRGEPAVGAGDDVLPSDKTGKADDALSDELGMFHDVAGVSNNARNQDFTPGDFDAFKQVIFVLVARIGRLETVGAGVDFRTYSMMSASAAS